MDKTLTGKMAKLLYFFNRGDQLVAFAGPDASAIIKVMNSLPFYALVQILPMEERMNPLLKMAVITTDAPIVNPRMIIP